MKYRTEILCFLGLAFLALAMARLVSPTARAHEPVTEACPVCLACPPEGFMLLEIPEEPTEGQQTIEEALQAIEAVQEATKKEPTP
jgi:hypothetical protein